MKRKRESVEIETTARTKPSKHSDDNGKDASTQERDTDTDINTAIGKMDNRLLADYVAQRSKRFGEDLSLVELEDIHVPESAILDTSEWNRDRLAANLPDFLIYVAQQHGASTDLFQAPAKPGSPHTLVLTGAALRAAELSRVLRKFQSKEATVAKLFAKHIKLKDATDFVKKTRINIGVGTPTRIVDLLTGRALGLEKLERVIIDTSYLDRKKRSIFDMKETQQPLVRLLNMDELKSRYTTTESPVKLIFY
ncbi:MAG: hypothetical protein L6R42_000298 [Xanthoria sp. 1 TBL-2021]|nr:MAG: hypothetical protein L6R42_000298 [Xanthoria sp. 1 TBL-2021]